MSDEIDAQVHLPKAIPSLGRAKSAWINAGDGMETVGGDKYDQETLQTLRPLGLRVGEEIYTKRSLRHSARPPTPTASLPSRDSPQRRTTLSRPARAGTQSGSQVASTATPDGGIDQPSRMQPPALDTEYTDRLCDSHMQESSNEKQMVAELMELNNRLNTTLELREREVRIECPSLRSTA
jgi:hypothetical protein